jgi:prepilin-type N-terminal cleavage/methylation domain-containing protein
MRNNFFINLIERHNKNTAPIWVSGFTLIELMVATTIFTIIMLMGVGSLVTSSNSAKRAQKLQIAVDNVNFAMESMTRELRMGSHYYCLTNGSAVWTEQVSDCSGGNGNVIIFTPQKVNGVQVVPRVAYKLVTRLSGVTQTLQRCEQTAGCYDIVAENVNVQLLKFTVLGSVLNDTIQPSVQILMQGVVNVGIGTPFALQTMASQRSAEK